MFRVGWFSTDSDDLHIEFHEFGHATQHWINDAARSREGRGQLFRGDVPIGDESDQYWFPRRAWDLRDPERMARENPAAQILVDAILQHPKFPKGAGREVLYRKYEDNFPFLIRSFLRQYQSDYSATNWKEAFAEAFAEGATKGDQARPIARYVYQAVVALYDDYEQALRSGDISSWDLDLLLAGFRDGIRPVPREDL